MSPTSVPDQPSGIFEWSAINWDAVRLFLKELQEQHRLKIIRLRSPQPPSFEVDCREQYMTDMRHLLRWLRVAVIFQNEAETSRLLKDIYQKHRLHGRLLIRSRGNYAVQRYWANVRWRRAQQEELQREVSVM
ncbi:hypothetical protein EIP91_011327 [Steccherinum ochraceum]|uniref:Uncharacterized protein n=1 Tax=Steccherinum ochraceum TaxID=92696 RepID=A0A4R0RBI1_9APHY|nr:hypothetical protein EIP91_011327 [Steccherinum ochraceum]